MHEDMTLAKAGIHAGKYYLPMPDQSMANQFVCNEILIVDPAAPVEVGRYVVVVKTTRILLVRRLLASSKRGVVLERLNPMAETELLRSELQSIYPVVSFYKAWNLIDGARANYQRPGPLWPNNAVDNTGATQTKG